MLACQVGLEVDDGLDVQVGVEVGVQVGVEVGVWKSKFL